MKCQIVGEKVSGLGAEAGFYDASDACGWGANVGPVWLVLRGGVSCKLVLSASGYGIAIYDNIKEVLVWSEWSGLRVEEIYVLT